ncbi:hypothetical protein NDU88_001466 [Pleurodeles waltl]|uniref:Uncharacterized protein n=1 Tax=Pleurodeles waltl TaxID=8319 RepID=A0AAV7LZE3_PLEWA|nr:hypothetical protein NDU88_001466 [Pleurodeles waltl]
MGDRAPLSPAHHRPGPAWRNSVLYLFGIKRASPRPTSISISARITVGAWSTLFLMGRVKGGTVSRAQSRQYLGARILVGRGIRATRPTYPLLLLMSGGTRLPPFASLFLFTFLVTQGGGIPAPARGASLLRSTRCGSRNQFTPCAGSTPNVLSAPARTRGQRRRRALSPRGRLATRSKPGSLLSSAAHGPLLSLGQRSPHIRRPGVEGRRRPGRRRSCLTGQGRRPPRPRGPAPQRVMSAPSAPAPRISGGRLRGPGASPQPRWADPAATAMLAPGPVAHTSCRQTPRQCSLGAGSPRGQLVPHHQDDGQ